MTHKNVISNQLQAVLKITQNWPFQKSLMTDGTFLSNLKVWLNPDDTKEYLCLLFDNEYKPTMLFIFRFYIIFGGKKKSPTILQALEYEIFT